MLRTQLAVDPSTRAAVLAAYNTTADPETRTRLQMVLLAHDHDLSPAEVGRLVHRSHDVVLRVLQRFGEGGVAAVPRRRPKGRAPTVTAAWEAELARVIELDPHAVGVPRASWTTRLLADYLAHETGIAVDQETVRKWLHRLGYVCKRYPRAGTHVDARREGAGAGGLGGKRLRVELLLAAATELGPDPAAPPAPPAYDQPAAASPTTGALVRDLVPHDLWAALPPDTQDILDLLGRADLYVQDELDVRLHPTLTRTWSRRGKRGQRLIPAPGRNVRFVAFGALDWRVGWCSVGYGTGRTAALYCKQLDHLVARSHARGRVALVLTDNARVHTARGSVLVRQTLARHGAALRLLYTPAYDPEANPTERLWRAVRTAVTHNHHRTDPWDLYRDVDAFFDELDADPARALRHIGGPGREPPPIASLALPLAA